MLVARLVVVVAILLLANVVTAEPSTVVADRVAGEAYTLATGVPARPIVGSPQRVLPPGGGTLVDVSPGTGIPPIGGVNTIDQLGVTVEGGPTAEGGAVTSTATVGFIELFDGLVRASNLLVVATSLQQGTRAASSGSVKPGSLLVAGQAYSSPRPNERVELPGLGYVVLNEQLVGGDGQATTSIAVRAIRLVVTEPNLQGVPPGTELVVAHAASGVPAIDATTTVTTGPPVSGAPIPSVPLSTRAPIDTTIDQSGGVGVIDLDNGNDNEEDSDNDDDSDNGNGGADSTPSSGTDRPIVVTVVVVVATPGSTPIPAPTAGRTSTTTTRP